ncbi:MAG: SPOR domain-containing protein [bacterium]
MHRYLRFCSVLLFLAGTRVWAQASPLVSPATDSLFRRARRLVSEGNGVAGRALVDSVLKTEAEGTPGYGNALFWRGALSETAAEAERDYRRVIVEYSLSAYADDALLAIAELEQARGDRAGALLHLQRFVREHPASPSRGTAAFAAARLAFEQRDTRTGCAMIAEARASVPTSDVELRNQIDYFGERCTTATANAMATPVATPAKTTMTPASRDSLGKTGTRATSVPTRPTPTLDRPRTTPPTRQAPAPVVTPAPHAATRPDVRHAPPRASYTIQLAAYGTRADAERLVHTLGAKGVKARVSGTTKPFRVRLGFYPTRQDAVDAVALLKQRGIIGFVTTEAPPPEGKAP